MMKGKRFFGKCMSFALILTLTATATAFTACGGNGNTGNTTELKVVKYNGGIGGEWLEDLKTSFEAKYKDVSLEDGKTGVTVTIVPDKTVVESMFGRGNHVIVYQCCNIDSLRNSDYLLDIGDAVTGKTVTVKDKVSTYDTAIETRLSDSQKQLLSSGNGSYYAVPHYETFGGIYYDVDLFNEMKWYFANTVNNTFISNGSATKSNGPDGVQGTVDDGLPATYTQFYALCDKISESMKPLISAGSVKRYLNFLATEAYLCLAGKSASYHYTLDSGSDTVNYITDIDAYVANNDNGVESATINSDTLYKLSQQAEKYQALNLLDTLMSAEEGAKLKYFTDSSIGESRTNTDAQKEFIFGDEIPAYQNAAMIVEGNYWVNEAKTHLQSYEKRHGGKTKNYAYMPLPAVISTATEITPEQGVNSYTLTDQAECYMMIDKKSVGDNSVLINLAKDFIMFANTEENLKAFTKKTGVTKALTYDMTDAEVSELSSIGQSIWKAKKKASEKGLLFYFGSNNAKYLKYSDYLSLNNSQGKTFWFSTTNQTSDLYYAFRSTESKHTTAKEFFRGMVKTASDLA